ncbi:MAG: hypothetical protein NWF07_13730 [Candidatus Bathyarchaeota archaeon]|nr:hypothetical protein [Candidatus Bathyarchaeota archaeon]
MHNTLMIFAGMVIFAVIVVVAVATMGGLQAIISEGWVRSRRNASENAENGAQRLLLLGIHTWCTVVIVVVILAVWLLFGALVAKAIGWI